MPTPKKKKPYALIRKDNTYTVYDLDSDQFEAIVQAIIGEMKHVLVPSIGLLGLSDVRDVIEQKEEKKPKEKEKPLESGTPEMDIASLHWLKEQEEMLKEWQMKNDAEFDMDGGRFS